MTSDKDDRRVGWESRPDGHDAGPGDNIVSLPTLAERDRMRREQARLKRGERGTEPLINMPPATKYLLGLLIGLFVLTGLVIDEAQADWVFAHFGFVPARLHAGTVDIYAIAGLFTHVLLHGGWMHIAMNGVMLAAFGSGVERWLGARRFLLLFAMSALAGAAAHYMLDTNSPFPMIGASGGLSGLFAAAIVMLGRGQREMGGRFGILPFALLWIGVSIGFGMMGGPDGSAVAWAAHVGGFLGGLAVVRVLRV